MSIELLTIRRYIVISAMNDLAQAFVLKFHELLMTPPLRLHEIQNPAMSQIPEKVPGSVFNARQ